MVGRVVVCSLSEGPYLCEHGAEVVGRVVVCSLSEGPFVSMELR